MNGPWAVSCVSSMQSMTQLPEVFHDDRGKFNNVSRVSPSFPRIALFTQVTEHEFLCLFIGHRLITA
jgi:hypothetical protein